MAHWHSEQSWCSLSCDGAPAGTPLQGGVPEHAPLFPAGASSQSRADWLARPARRAGGRF